MLRSLDFRFSWFGRLPASIPYAKLKKRRKNALTMLERATGCEENTFLFVLVFIFLARRARHRVGPFFSGKIPFFSAIHIGGAAPPSKQ